MDKAGVIYILTNPSFPEYVKIGYHRLYKTPPLVSNKSLPLQNGVGETTETEHRKEQITPK